MWKQLNKRWVKDKYHVKKRDNNDNCLPSEALWISSWLQAVQPLSKLANTWATIKSTMAAKPRLYASWLGCLHSNNHSLKCFSYISIKHIFNAWLMIHLHIKKIIDNTSFWAASALIPRIPAVISSAIMRRQTNAPTPLLTIAKRIWSRQWLVVCF